MDDERLILSYGRPPVARRGREQWRTIVQDGVRMLVIFPRGVWRMESVRGCLPLLLLFAVPLGLVLAHGHPAGLFLFGIAGIWGVLVWGDYDESVQQVEFEIRADELFCVIFGRKGIEQRRWPRAEILGLRLSYPREGDSHLYLVKRRGQESELLKGSADVLGEALRVLQDGLDLPPYAPKVAPKQPMPDLETTLRLWKSRSVQAVKRIGRAMKDPRAPDDAAVPGGGGTVTQEWTMAGATRGIHVERAEPPVSRDSRRGPAGWDVPGERRL